MAKCNRFIVLVAALGLGCTAVYEGELEPLAGQGGSYGWDPGLTKRRARSRNGVNRFFSAPDPDPHDRYYTLTVVGERPEQYWTNGGKNGPSYRVNDPNGPFKFSWGRVGGRIFGNLSLDTTGHRLSPLVTDHDRAWTYFGFNETTYFNRPARMPPVTNARFSVRLLVDGPFSARFNKRHKREDGRVVLGIAWRDTDNGLYICELTLHSMNRFWKTTRRYVSNSNHGGRLKQFIIMGGPAWGYPRPGGFVNGTVPPIGQWLHYDIPWGEILQTAKREGQLRAPLGAGAKIVSIGAGIETSGEVKLRMLVSDFRLGVGSAPAPNPTPDPNPDPNPNPNPTPTPTGDTPPRGFLDGVQNGRAWGWACDPDNPAASIDVHLYVGGPAGSGAQIYGVKANKTHEDAVSAGCGGGAAHRFAFNIPNWQQRRGQPVYAYGIDLTHEPHNRLLNSAPRALR
jgi:hypothetical protein